MANKTCTTCGTSLPESEFYESGGQLKAACKSCHRSRVYKHREKVRANGLCIECLVPVDPGPLCETCKEVHRNRYHANREEYGEKAKTRRRRLKAEAFDAYGGPICACCGELNLEFLTIDHTAGNGAEHRRQMRDDAGWNVNASQMSGSHLYLWLKKNCYPPGFRVLCMNCNFSLGRFGYCPHGLRVETQMG